MDDKYSKTILNLYTLHQFKRFVIVGVINTIAGYGIYFISIKTGLTYFEAWAVAVIVASIVNFYLSKKFVFQVDDSSWIIKSKFILSVALHYFGNVMLTKLFIAKFCFSSEIAGFISMLVFMLLNFAIQKLFVFKKIGFM